MRNIIIILTLLLTVSLTTQGQKQRQTQHQPQRQQVQKAKKAQTQHQQTQQKKKQQGRGHGRRGGTRVQQPPTTKEIRGLQSERSTIRKEISEKEKALQANRADVARRLENLMIINGEIDNKQRSIDSIQDDITQINDNIGELNDQIADLQTQLGERKEKFIESIRYMSRHRSIQDKIIFVFSAKNFTQMYRRFRFLRQFAHFQQKQAEKLKEKRREVSGKNDELKATKDKKSVLLHKDKQAQSDLKGKQKEQEGVVNTLKAEQSTLESVIAEQRKRDAALNAKIDQLVAIEVEKARQRAAEEARKQAAARAAAQAEAKRKAAEQAAARKKAAEEAAAKRKAAAEAAAKERARRLEEAKAREAAAKAREAEAKRQAAEAAKKSAAERAEAQRKAREAAAERAEAQRRAAEEKKRAEREEAAAKKAAKEAERQEKEEAEATVAAPTIESSTDRALSGSFESNRGRLPMPITGSYKIVSHFGQYNVEGLKNVTLDNKGINIKGSPGCQARSIFAGEVSAVFSLGGSMVVMVRHGSYISVYCNLKSVSVHTGQKVSARQPLGAVGDENILQFQLRRETAKLNPEAWLGR